MKKTQKILLIVSIMLLTSLLAIVAVNAETHQVAYAISNSEFSVDKYTDSDCLLSSAGTLETKTIKDFAREVKTAQIGTSVADIEKVIPIQYLNARDGVYKYCGLEYGFFIAIENNKLDLLLIDFNYNPYNKDSDNELFVRIDPILQQSFEKVNLNETIVWKKLENNYKYYVANPSFLTSIFNENALNANDIGYNKQNDEGLIIQQSRLNFGQVLYKTEEDLEYALLEDGKELVVKAIVDIGCSVISDFVPGADIVFTAIDYILQAGQGINEIVFEGKEQVLVKNGENTIFSEQSKTNQKNNPSLLGYSRTVMTRLNDEIILSDDDDSYMETIILMNDTNYRTRLARMFDFEIVKRNQGYASPVYVLETDKDGNEKHLIASYREEKVLYNDYLIETEIGNGQIENEESYPCYILPNGYQKFTFTPLYSGNYSFNIPNDVELYIDDEKIVDVNDCYLKGSTIHHIALKNHELSSKIVISDISYDLLNVFNAKNKIITLQPYDSVAYKLNCLDQKGYYKIYVSDPNIEIVNDCVKIDDLNYYTYYSQNSMPYLLIRNKKSSVTQVDIAFTEPQQIVLGESQTALDDVVSFSNNFDTSVRYVVTITNWAETNRMVVYDEENESIASQYLDGNKMVFSFVLSRKQKCYIGSDIQTQSQINIAISQEQLRWQVDGVFIDSQIASLTRGATHTISLILQSANGNIVINSNFVPAPTASYYSLSQSAISISYAAPIAPIYIYPVYSPQFLLTVNVQKGIEGTITFDKCGGSGGTNAVDSFYGQSLPKAIAPTRKGYTFMGYYSSPNGVGTQYYDENMIGVIQSDLTNDTTLFAYWDANSYNVTFMSENSKVATVSVKYGQPMPVFRNYATKKKNYIFAGYFTVTDGKGVQYYGMEVVNDEYAAEINQQAYYYYEKLKSVRTMDKDSEFTLYAHFTPMSLKCVYNILCEQTIIKTDSFDIYGDKDTSVNAPTIKDHKFSYFQYGATKYTANPAKISFTMKRNTGHYDKTNDMNNIILDQAFCAVYEKDACIAEGTLITLADGTQVPVESLSGSERLLVWNMFTGQFDSAEIVFIDNEPLGIKEVINLGFSDGTTIKVISEHAFWDLDLNKYVYLDKNASQYIGHRFNKQVVDENGNMTWCGITLTSVTLTQEETTAWSPVTYNHLCYYVNGMLSIPGGILGLFNYLSIDSATMTINHTALSKDIEQYGLFTYEEFSKLVSITPEVFDAFNGQYLRIAIGKGMITVEEIQTLLNKYARFFQ